MPRMMVAYKGDKTQVFVPEYPIRPTSCKAGRDELVPLRGWPYFVGVKRGEHYVGYTVAPFMHHPQHWLDGINWSE